MKLTTQEEFTAAFTEYEDAVETAYSEYISTCDPQRNSKTAAIYQSCKHNRTITIAERRRHTSTWYSVNFQTGIIGLNANATKLWLRDVEVENICNVAKVIMADIKLPLVDGIRRETIDINCHQYGQTLSQDQYGSVKLRLYALGSKQEFISYVTLTTFNANTRVAVKRAELFLTIEEFTGVLTALLKSTRAKKT